MSSTGSHRAAVLSTPKGKHSVENRPTPQLAPDEVLVKITAAAINPADWKLRDSSESILKFPAVLGSDGAGVIAAVGDSVDGFSPGERVFFQGIINKIEHSTFQQFCKMPVALVGKTPDNISDDEAASICVAAMAAVTALYAKNGHGFTPPWITRPPGNSTPQAGTGNSIVILGGSGSAGRYAIQLARLSGFTRIVTNGSPAHHAALRDLGATAVLDRFTATPDDYAKAAGGDESDPTCVSCCVVDAVATSQTQLLGVEVLHKLQGGTVVSLLGLAPPAEFENRDPERIVTIRGVMGMGSLPHLRTLAEGFMRAAGGEDGWLARGLLKPNRLETVGGLDQVDVALDRLREGVSGIKLVLRPQEGTAMDGQG